MDYAVATGRDVETAEVLKARVESGRLDVFVARSMMIAQGFSPNAVANERYVAEVLKARVAQNLLTLDAARLLMSNGGLNPDMIGKEVK